MTEQWLISATWMGHTRRAASPAGAGFLRVSGLALHPSAVALPCATQVRKELLCCTSLPWTTFPFRILHAFIGWYKGPDGRQGPWRRTPE